MAIAEFEEKEFEVPLSAQLLGGGGRIWSPGQVLENEVGFDAAMLTHSVVLWSVFGIPTPTGVVVDPLWWPGLSAQAALSQKPPPTFLMNAFLQYKRPMTTRLGRDSAFADPNSPSASEIA